MNTLEIDTRYPVRNNAWSFDRMTGRWSAEASELEASEGGFRDPWNRPFPSDTHRTVYDPSGEDVALWVYETTIAGDKVECAVLND